MEKFIKFKENVNLKQLTQTLSDSRIILLRESQTTNTIQIQLLDHLTEREIKQAFSPLEIAKIFNEFPYPLKHRRFSLPSFRSIGKLIKKNS
ncbi:MAG: hypothetical protein SCK70_10295 [bacterium]|nr:hypothetical protein [bacterium]